MNSELQARIEAAKARVAERMAEIKRKKEEEAASLAKTMNLQIQKAVSAVKTAEGWTWNGEQSLAIQNAVFRKNFCLIGAAGTGKTTTLRGALLEMLKSNAIPPLEKSTKNLTQGAPGIALISYTRRAVRNIAKQMPDELKPHCMTFHKLVEYEPFFYEEWSDEKDDYIKRMRFQPARNLNNPLPQNLTTIVIDEGSMLSIDFFNELIDALPNPEQVQFIVLGDLNQLPPVYGQAILGKKLLEYPIVELTQVYRQALESPIISLALGVKNNNFEDFVKDAVDKWGVPALPLYGDGRPGTNYAASFNPRNITTKIVLNSARGKVTLHPWKKRFDNDDSLQLVQQQLKLWILDGTYDPKEDLVLCPWAKSFGTDELNKAIANTISQRDGLEVWEIIAGFNKYYYAIGDRLMVDKLDAEIIDIKRNFKYLGKPAMAPSKDMNRWGGGGHYDNMFSDNASTEDIDMMLLHAADVVDRTREASHIVKVRMLDTGEEREISDAGTLNATTFGYAITVHKAQGSECRRVFFITGHAHAAMCSRELVYTAITRASEELYILMPPNLLDKAARNPRIKGDTLPEKLAFFNARLGEKDES